MVKILLTKFQILKDENLFTLASISMFKFQKKIKSLDIERLEHVHFSYDFNFQFSIFFFKSSDIERLELAQFNIKQSSHAAFSPAYCKILFSNNVEYFSCFNIFHVLIFLTYFKFQN